MRTNPGSSFPRRRPLARAAFILALCLPACAPLAAEIRSLTILHTNDVHAHISPSDTHLGGFAYLAAAIRRERAGCTDCILLNAGDLVQGTPVSTIFHGLPVFELANLFGYDAATLGNHDFDYGWMQARKFIETAKYPMVSCNIVGADNGLFTAQPYVILTVNKLRVAVLGALTDEMRNLSTPKLMQQWHTTPVLATVRRYAAELKEKSDIVILLGHLTAEEELRFLESVPEIPVVVSGHVHSGLEREITRQGRIMVRVKGYGEELGRLDLKVDTATKAPASFVWKRIPIDSTKIEPAADVAAQVKRLEDDVTARVDEPLATARHAFDKRQLKAVMEQAMRDETGADFAFMNAGGVRDVLPAGALLVRHIWNIMPFDNLVVIAHVKGRDLPRVVLGDRKVEPDREYTLAVSDFTAQNQSAPSQLGTTGLVFGDDVGLLRDMLVDWFRKKKVVE
jgi:2',3'-cyclic-nucleotide 2'-phosphodiesterase (5'-nucleotidase family)